MGAVLLGKRPAKVAGLAAERSNCARGPASYFPGSWRFR